MGKVCRIKQSTKSYKERRGFTKKKVEGVLNTFNAEDVVNSSVNNESTLENNTVNSNASSPENASSSSFNLSNISTASSRKVKPIGYSTPSSSQSITGYRIIDVDFSDPLIKIKTFLKSAERSYGENLSERTTKMRKKKEKHIQLGHIDNYHII